MVQSAQVNLRPRGRGETRARIISAARELFAVHGVEGTSVRAIALRCNLTDPAVYYHFPTKRDIVEVILVAPALEPLVPVPCKQATRAALIEHAIDAFYSWTEHPDVLRLVLCEGLQQDAMALEFRHRAHASFEATVWPALHYLYEDSAADVRAALGFVLRGMLFDAILAHGRHFSAVVESGEFRGRVRNLVSNLLPACGNEGLA